MKGRTIGLARPFMNCLPSGADGAHYSDFNPIKNPRHAKRNKHQHMKSAPR